MKSLEDHLILCKRSCNRSSINMERGPTFLFCKAWSCPCCIPNTRETGPELGLTTAPGSQHRLRLKVTILEISGQIPLGSCGAHSCTSKNEIIHPKVTARIRCRHSSGPAATKNNFWEQLEQHQDFMWDKAFDYSLVLWISPTVSSEEGSGQTDGMFLPIHLGYLHPAVKPNSKSAFYIYLQPWV